MIAAGNQAGMIKFVLPMFVGVFAIVPMRAADDLSFEVASVKSGQRPPRMILAGCSGGPGTSAPATWNCRYTTLAGLLFGAYDLDLYQFSPPDWMNNAWFEVIAKVPPGTTKAQFQKMQQRLLEDRFKLALHWEPKERTVYELQVAKTGLKMRESPAGSPDPVTEVGRVPGSTMKWDDYPAFPDGVSGLMGVNNYWRWRSSNITLPMLTRELRRHVRSDVIDATGLTGNYDIDITFQERPIEDLPYAPPFVNPIEKALQERLGLRVETKKGSISVPVIDHIERTPTEN